MVLNFCDGCNKIVSDKEVSLFITKPSHILEKTVNAYKNRNPKAVGCYLVTQVVVCGRIREPSPEEYFIYHTLKING